MKVKMKLDVSSIKKWLLENGEKVAFGVVLLVFLLFTWSAVSHEVLDATKQPDVLRQRASEVKQKVADSTWDEKSAAIVDYDKRAIRERVAAEPFSLPVLLNPPNADPKTRRDDPAVFPVEELRVAAGFGSFALRESVGPQAGGAKGPPPRAAGRIVAHKDSKSGVKPQASSKLKGQSWAVITGLVPIQKQAQEYSRAFDHALGENPATDSPHFTAYVIERAEVSDASPEKLEWKVVPSAQPFTKDFEPGAPEIVASEYVDPVLTAPLGPLVSSGWDDSVRHPKIPLAGAASSESPEQAASGGAPVAPPVANQPNAQPPGGSAAASPKSVSVTYHLLRIFDFTVEPHQKYRYRVKTVLANPNFNVKPQFLKNPNPQNPKEITTEWSDPSGVVVVPDGYQVFAGDVRATLGEPTAKLMLSSISTEDGLEASTEHEVQRGAVANLSKEVGVRDPRNNSVQDVAVDFKTNMVVLDIRGGKVLARKDKSLKSPGEVLLLDSQGNLLVRNELSDQLLYEDRKLPEDTDSRSKPSDLVPSETKPKPRPKPRAR